MYIPSTRAQVITRSRYSRPLDITPGPNREFLQAQGYTYEPWGETIDRVIRHQEWLWERAQRKPLDGAQRDELEALRELMLAREALPAGRTLWLGGTSVAKAREASQFNCSFLRIETIHDLVDAYWLLLQGCGVGFEPVVGTLNGFAGKVKLSFFRREPEYGNDPGEPDNASSVVGRTYYLTIGDSAEAWAKAIGKLLAMKWDVDEVVIITHQIRPAGYRLKGYGWLSAGDELLIKAIKAICGILNARAGQLLTRLDILDIMNWLGTTLSSRRSAEIALCPYEDPEWEEFAYAKKDHFLHNPQRAQSNNSLVFHRKPSLHDLHDLFDIIQDGGGSEPGFVNASAALLRAPWFKGLNPCAEILLGNKSFCNLVTVDVAKFVGPNRNSELMQAVYLIARANYRQTCVELRDGVLQESWHELNSFLRLCGVGLAGIVPAMTHWHDPANAFRKIRAHAQWAANSMADELKMPRPKAVTTVKPDGTLGKIMDTTEGCHRPLGKYIFNNVRFGAHDDTVDALASAGYRVFADPYGNGSVLATLPSAWHNIEFDFVNGVHCNLEPACGQLERYKILMQNYVDHNCSITVSYSPEEVDDMVQWIYDNWDSYVGVSFLPRVDPLVTAEELGYPYLPQEVVDEDTYEAYVSQLKPVNLDEVREHESSIEDDPCATGACPIR